MASEKVTARQSVINRTGRTPEELVVAFQAKQKQDFAFKKAYAEIRAREFYDHEEINGNCYCAVGGLDSIVLYVFLKSIGLTDVPGVSVSFLEDRTVRQVHKALGIQMLHPAKKENGREWTKVGILKQFGYPVLSKEIANKINLLQKGTPQSATVRHAIITGETGAYGGYQKNSRMKMSQKWLEKFGGWDEEGAALGYAHPDFLVSDKCCYYLKEKPCNDYARESGRFPYMGLMASEGGRRQKALMLHGCNYIEEGTKRSCPFAIFYHSDVLQLALDMDAWYQEHWREFGTGFKIDSIIPKAYGEIKVGEDGKLYNTGSQRTGCNICMFGIHLEKRPHRFDLLRERNYAEWHYWMYDAGFGKVLDYIGVGWQDYPNGLIDYARLGGDAWKQ